MADGPRSPTSPGLAWILRHAWRDSRGHRRPLLLFMLGTVFGLAALTGIRGFRDSLSEAVDAEARTLLGADLELRTNREITPAVDAWVAEAAAAAPGGRVAKEARFRSMGWFPKVETSRFLQVRAIEGDFPFYGELETDPPGLRPPPPDEPVAIVERSLLATLGLGVGDELRLGTVTFRIVGGLVRVPGDSEVETLFAPRVIVPLRQVEASGLLVRGSLLRNYRALAWDDGLPESVAKSLPAARSTVFAAERVRPRTVEDERRRVGRTLEQMTGFLQLTGLVAMLLGGVGVAGGVQLYLRDKLAGVAVLRCLGAPTGYAFSAVFLQVAVAGGLGAALGTALGAAVQPLVPLVAGPFLPFAADLRFAGDGLLPSFLFGWSVIVLCSLLPMFQLRRATPLTVIRGLGDAAHPAWRERGVWLVSGALLLLTLAFALRSGPDWRMSLGLTGALVVAALVLAGVGALLRWALRRFAPARAPYAWRLGLSSLHRPRNGTLVTVVTLGLALFLVLTLFLVRGTLLDQVALERQPDTPDTILYDLQPDQVAGVRAVLGEAGLPVIEDVPIVTMRLAEVRGKTIAELRRDRADKAEGWALNWEYRTSWRGALSDSETLVDGSFDGRAPGPGEPVPVSVESSIARALAVKVGDPLVLDVQGVPMPAVVASVREVDWRRLRPNFYLLFPPGVLEEAPRFHAVVTRTGGGEAATRLQNRVGRDFPNVSLVDLSLVIETVGRVLDRVALVLQFLGAFVLATGVIVLAAALFTSRPQRLRESVLLRTLGASRGLLRGLFAVEYALVGLIAGLAGAGLAAGAAWGLARWVFLVEAQLPLLPIALGVLGLAGLTLATGSLVTRGVASEPPLAVIRREQG